MNKSSQLDGNMVRKMIRIAIANAEGGAALHRLDGVLLIAEGCRCCEVAGWFGVNRRTVTRWVYAAYVRCLEGLIERHHGGRPSKLTSCQAQRIRLDFQESPGVYGYHELQWTGKRLALHLDKCYGVEMSVRSCQRMIARSRASLSS